MKILSIDVGIKNLAFCLFVKPEGSENFNIKKWDVVNISEKETFKCVYTDKTGQCCKPAKFKKDDKCFCLKHSKKQEYQVPSSEHKPAFINKQKLQNLYDIASKYGIKYAIKAKKTELIDLINEHISNTYFQHIESTNASDVNLYDIGTNIKHHFDTLFSNEDKIDYVIIENQISPIATRMKTIQGMIVQYFVMSPIKVDFVEFISASNKLKGLTKNTSNNTKTLEEKTDKAKYNDRKKLGIEKCLEMLTNDFRFNNQLDHFNNHKKKDDLSDSFLQGLWFINNRSI
jgi:hypothetical protein